MGPKDVEGLVGGSNGQANAASELSVEQNQDHTTGPGDANPGADRD